MSGVWKMIEVKHIGRTQVHVNVDWSLNDKGWIKYNILTDYICEQMSFCIVFKLR